MAEHSIRCSAQHLQLVDIPGGCGDQAEEHRHAEEIDEEHEEPHREIALAARGHRRGSVARGPIGFIIAR